MGTSYKRQMMMVAAIARTASLAGCLWTLRCLMRRRSSRTCSKQRFDVLVQREWSARVHLMRTRVQCFQHREIPGQHRFIVQYSAEHSNQKRVSAISHAEAVPVIQEFDHSSFNFCKASREETMFAASWPLGKLKVTSEPGEPSSHPVLINISPLAYCHIVVPFFRDCKLAQVLDETSIGLAIRLAASSARVDFKLRITCTGTLCTLQI